jgi:hypothetical protein
LAGSGLAAIGAGVGSVFFGGWACVAGVKPRPIAAAARLDGAGFDLLEDPIVLADFSIVGDPVAAFASGFHLSGGTAFVDGWQCLDAAALIRAMVDPLAFLFGDAGVCQGSVDMLGPAGPQCLDLVASGVRKLFL